jgi:hypothetical protein
VPVDSPEKAAANGGVQDPVGGIRGQRREGRAPGRRNLRPAAREVAVGEDAGESLQGEKMAFVHHRGGGRDGRQDGHGRAEMEGRTGVRPAGRLVGGEGGAPGGTRAGGARRSRGGRSSEDNHWSIWIEPK